MRQKANLSKKLKTFVKTLTRPSKEKKKEQISFILGMKRDITVVPAIIKRILK